MIADSAAATPRTDLDEWFTPKRFALLLGLLNCAVRLPVHWSWSYSSSR